MQIGKKKYYLDKTFAQVSVVTLSKWTDGRLAILCLFNSIPVISGLWVDDHERLCAMESSLWLRRFRLERGSNSGSLDQ